MFINVLGQHVSILTESSSGPSKKIDPYLRCVGDLVRLGLSGVRVAG